MSNEFFLNLSFATPAQRSHRVFFLFYKKTYGVQRADIIANSHEAFHSFHAMQQKWKERSSWTPVVSDVEQAPSAGLAAHDYYISNAVSVVQWKRTTSAQHQQYLRIVWHRCGSSTVHRPRHFTVHLSGCIRGSTSRTSAQFSTHCPHIANATSATHAVESRRSKANFLHAFAGSIEEFRDVRVKVTGRP